jgi:hypothetical protein
MIDDATAAANIHIHPTTGIATPIVTISLNAPPGLESILIPEFARGFVAQGWTKVRAITGDWTAFPRPGVSLRGRAGNTALVQSGHETIFDGSLVPPDGWSDLVQHRGETTILMGIGLMDSQQWPTELPAAAAAGRIVGATAAVTLTSGFGTPVSRRKKR